MNEYVIVIKEGLFWLAKKMVLRYYRDDVEEDRVIEDGEFYQIDMNLSHNGFEYEIDAWNYLVHVQDKEAEALNGQKANIPS